MLMFLYFVKAWNMGNAAAKGIEYLLPSSDQDFDLIVLGLQESTYKLSAEEDTGDDEIDSDHDSDEKDIKAKKSAAMRRGWSTRSGASIQSVRRRRLEDIAEANAVVPSKANLNSSFESAETSLDCNCLPLKNKNKSKIDKVHREKKCVEILVNNISENLGAGYLLVCIVLSSK